MAEDISAVALHGGVGKGWAVAKLDGGIDEGGVNVDMDWVTSELGGIAEWARERGGEDERGGDGADNVEGGGFD
jgi:hypothetical protein